MVTISCVRNLRHPAPFHPLPPPHPPPRPPPTLPFTFTSVAASSDEGSFAVPHRRSPIHRAVRLQGFGFVDRCVHDSFSLMGTLCCVPETEAAASPAFLLAEILGLAEHIHSFQCFPSRRYLQRFAVRRREKKESFQCRPIGISVFVFTTHLALAEGVRLSDWADAVCTG